MERDELVAAWQADDAGPAAAQQESVTRIERRSRALDRALLRRDLVEIAAGAVAVAAMWRPWPS